MGGIYYKNKNTLQLWDRRSCRNSSLQAVCDTPIARITGCVSSLRIQVGDSPWNYSVACTRVNRVMLFYCIKNIINTSAVSSTKLGLILIVCASCVIHRPLVIYRRIILGIPITPMDVARVNEHQQQNAINNNNGSYSDTYFDLVLDDLDDRHRGVSEFSVLFYH